MKVLHINSYYSDSKLYKNLFDRQIKQNMDLDVFVPVPTNYDMSKRDFGDYTVVSKNHNYLDRVWYEYKQTKILKDLEAKYTPSEYDLFHAHSLFTNGGIAYKLHKKYGIKYMVAVRNTDMNSFFKKLPHLRKYGVDILEHAEKIIFISDSFKAELIEKYLPASKKDAIIKKMTTIPNGIDDFWLENRHEKTEARKELKELNLIYVGKIMKLKNVPTTVEACEILQERGYDVSLTIVGQILDQSEFNKIKNKPFINYVGFQSMEEIIKHYRANDIFVMPSFGETFGLVYVEAMSQGLPVIYTKGQGFDGQFPEGEVGYHVSPKDAVEIADRVELTLNNYNQMSRNSTKQAAYFDWDDIGQRYLTLYQNIMS